jgi:uncharacterized protein YlzI (FlbEa/FlbD family)
MRQSFIELYDNKGNKFIINIDQICTIEDFVATPGTIIKMSNGETLIRDIDVSKIMEALQSRFVHTGTCE